MNLSRLMMDQKYYLETNKIICVEDKTIPSKHTAQFTNIFQEEERY